MDKKFEEEFDRLNSQDQQEVLNLIELRTHYGHDTCYKCFWNRMGICKYYARNEPVSMFVTDPSKSCCVHFEGE